MFLCPLQIDGVWFKSVEHFYQCKKALHHGLPHEEVEKIRQAQSGFDAMDLARGLNNPDWSPEPARGVMWQGLRVKFAPGSGLAHYLCDTYPHPLAEENPNPRWAIGLRPNHPARDNPSEWKGENWLGLMLEDLREELRALWFPPPPPFPRASLPSRQSPVPLMSLSVAPPPLMSLAIGPRSPQSALKSPPPHAAQEPAPPNPPKPALEPVPEPTPEPPRLPLPDLASEPHLPDPVPDSSAPPQPHDPVSDPAPSTSAPTPNQESVCPSVPPEAEISLTCSDFSFDDPRPSCVARTSTPKRSPPLPSDISSPSRVVLISTPVRPSQPIPEKPAPCAPSPIPALLDLKVSPPRVPSDTRIVAARTYACPVCTTSYVNLEDHFTDVHLPWWFTPYHACWICRVKLSSAELESHTHWPIPRFSDEHLSEWVHLSLGLLYSIFTMCGYGTVYDYLTAYRQSGLHWYGPPLVESQEQTYLRMVISELYDYQPLLSPLTFPPSHFSHALHWGNIAPVFALLDPSQREILKYSFIMREPCGTYISTPPPLPFDDVGLVDSHLHLDRLLTKLRLSSNRLPDVFATLLKESPALPVPLVGLIANFCDPWKWDRAEEIVSLAPFPTYSCFGVHPHNVCSVPLSELPDQLQRVVAQPTCVGVGETGLDYTCPCKCAQPWDQHKEEFSLQEVFFRAHIRIALSVNKVLVIHCRDEGTGWAGQRALAILQEEGATGLPIHRHCFLGDQQELELWQATLENVIFSFPCVAPQISRLQSVLARVPLSQILLETDSPYLCPEDTKPPNHPGNLGMLLRHIAERRNLPVKLLAMAIQLNTSQFYGVRF